jgi:hypothetical protein
MESDVDLGERGVLSDIENGVRVVPGRSLAPTAAKRINIENVNLIVRMYRVNFSIVAKNSELAFVCASN